MDYGYTGALRFETDTSSSNTIPPVVADINHASDLIKKRCKSITCETFDNSIWTAGFDTRGGSVLVEHASPDKAIRYSNLYSQYISQPVLSQKWAILYFLHKMSDADSDEAEPLDGTRAPQRIDTPGHSRAGSARPVSSRKGQSEGGGSSMDDAFSTPGLPRLPTFRDAGQSEPRGIHKKVGDLQGSAKGRQLNGFGRTEDPRAPTRESGHRDSQTTDMQPVEANGDSPDQRAESPEKEEDPAREDCPARPPETALLRDLPFTLQGLSSTNLSFNSASVLTLPPTLPVPFISLLHTLAEPSLLYRGLSEHVQSSHGGLIAQSLKAAIGQELRSYLGLVVTLEGEIRRALTSLGSGELKTGIGKAGVTLKRCVIWTREATMGLRLMSLMVEESKSLFP